MKKSAPLILIAAILCLGCSQSGSDNGKADNAGETGQSDTQTAKVERYKPKRDSKVVAYVNGVPIYEDELRGGTVDMAITDEILYQEGLRRGVDKKYEQRVNDFKTSLVVRDVRVDLMENLPPVKEITDEDIEEYYNKNKDKYSAYHIVEINFSDENLSPEILKLAGEGEELRDIASNLASSDPKVIFNDLGIRRELVQYFNDKKVGSLSEVVKKSDGTFSVLKIVEVKQTPLANLKFSIRNNLEARKEANLIENKSREIARENNIEIEIVR